MADSYAQIVFMFYETEKEGLTVDNLVYHGDALSKSYQLWKDHKKGVLSSFPFGVFAFARLDDRLADSEIWASASRKDGRDPMGLTPSQPNIEFFTTECYGGPKQNDIFPVNNKHSFSMIPELFAPRSRGTVTLRNADPTAIPVVDCGYLTDPLDLEVLAEACRFGNEIVMEGKGTKDIVKGSWPPEASHHQLSTRDDVCIPESCFILFILLLYYVTDIDSSGNPTLRRMLPLVSLLPHISTLQHLLTNHRLPCSRNMCHGQDL